jgi:ATP-dependent protease HslVU (ClpYQ) peptidase subunit
MTCIVAVTHGDKVFMAGDRGMSDGNTIVSSKEPKIFDTGEYLFGWAGNIGLGQSIIHGFDFPLIQDDEEIFTVFIPHLKKYITKRFDISPDDHSHFILGYNGRVYEISTDGYGCIEYDNIAIGSGKEFAMGSLYSTVEEAPLVRVTLAVEAAITLSPGCAGPIDWAEM